MINSKQHRYTSSSSTAAKESGYETDNTPSLLERVLYISGCIAICVASGFYSKYDHAYVYGKYILLYFYLYG